MTEPLFRWMHNEDPMATEKLAEGIRNFASDTRKLEAIVSAKLAEKRRPPLWPGLPDREPHSPSHKFISDRVQILTWRN